MKELIPVFKEETKREAEFVGLLSCVDLVRNSQECVYLWYEIGFEVNSLYSGRALGRVYRM